MNWKEKLIFLEWLQSKYMETFPPKMNRTRYDLLQDFISTEIIEKLIADIPDVMSDNLEVKQQLRDKWL